MERKFYNAIYDAAFKGIFCKPSNKDLLEALLENSLQTKIEVQSIGSSEIPKENIYIRNKTLDAVVKVDKKIIIIEVNSSIYNGLNRRNASFAFAKYSEETKVSESYKEMRNIIQINYSAGLPKDYPTVGIYKMVDIDTKREYVDNIVIYEFNVDKIVNKCYNENDETYKFIALLNTEKDKLHEKCKGDKIMAKFEKEIKELNKDSEFINFMTAEEDAIKTHNTLLSNSYEEGEKHGIEIGEKKGIEIGKKSSVNEIARRMIEQKIDDSVIIKITGLTEEEINKLK